jgi:accessory gene regulator B
MINKISALLSEEIKLRLNSSDNEKEIYAYSIEVLISLFINLVILSFTAYILKKQAELIIFILFFSVLRSYAGGYHAKTHIECMVLSFCIFMISALSSTYLAEYGEIILISGILLSVTMVFFLAPAESENKPLSKKQRAKYKKISRIIVILLSVSAVCLYFIRDAAGYVYITAAVAMSVESVSLLKH